jgi:hypothetical protein
MYSFIYYFTGTKRTDNKKRQAGKHTHKNQKTNEKNTTEKQMKTCKKGQQKQRSRFLQEYKSKTSYTLEDGHVGQNSDN